MDMQAGKYLRKTVAGYSHWCPGCDHLHHIPVGGPHWKFNGDLEKPTFSPSVKHTYQWPDEPMNCCHYFIKAGQIQYCEDSTHALAGKTLPLPELPTDYQDL